MHWSVKRILDLPVAATDGRIGSIHDLYFEDQNWSLRYFVVDTGGWLKERRVLISPRVVGKPNWESPEIPAALTMAQVEKSPPYESDQPISQQYETELASYYVWPAPMFYAPGATEIPPAIALPVDRPVHAAVMERTPGPHLRSVRDTLGYTIHALDGDIGHAEDFIVSDGQWRIESIVIDTRNWFPGRKVAISACASKKIRWADQAIYIDTTKKDIETAPRFDANEPVNARMEIHWYDYEGKEKDPALR